MYLNPSLDLKTLIKKYQVTHGNALDLGCGNGRDSKFLIDKGFDVVGVDKKDYVDISIRSHPQFKFVHSKIEDISFDRYDLINAQWVLPFIKVKYFDKVINSVKSSLKPGGYFLGQLLGPKDEWAANNKVITMTNFEAKELLNDLDVIKFSEVELRGFTKNNKPKYWHYFEFILQKL